MKSKFLLCICAIILASSLAASTEVSSLEALNKIETSRFGKTLLDTVQLQLPGSNGSVDKLLQQLTSMSKQLQLDQSEDDQTNERVQEDCSVDLTRLSTDISDMQLKISDSTEVIAQDEPILTQKQDLVDGKSSLLANLKQRLSDLNDHFTAKSTAFQTDKQEHEHAASVISYARNVIQGSFGGHSFLEMKRPSPTSLIHVSEHFAESNNAVQYTRKSWNSFFKVLSQVTASAPILADAGAVQKVLDIVADLLAKIEESFATETKEFQLFESDFNASRDNLEEEVSETQSKIEVLAASISTLEHRIKTAQTDIDSTQSRLTEKLNEQSGRTAYCSEQASQYATRSNDRNDQLEIIGQVVELLSSQLDVIEKYVDGRD